MLPLTLAGCHLFGSGAIECTQDELPGCAAVDTEADADADADADSDTDADGDSDTQPADPMMGAAYLGVDRSGTRWFTKVFDPERAPLLSLSSSGALEGPIAWRTSDSSALVADGVAMFLVTSAGVNRYGGELPGAATDILPARDGFFVTTANALLMVTETSVEQLVFSRELVALTSVFEGADGRLLLLDQGGSTSGARPTLYAYDIDDDVLTVLHGGYDTTRSRSIDAFLGPGDEPFVCSSAGGVYRVEDLVNGVTAPERLATSSLTDVVDCDYDPFVDKVMLFSASQGVVQVDSLGRTETFRTLTDAAALIRGRGFFIQ